jgi:hypothetical protein
MVSKSCDCSSNDPLCQRTPNTDIDSLVYYWSECDQEQWFESTSGIHENVHVLPHASKLATNALCSLESLIDGG